MIGWLKPKTISSRLMIVPVIGGIFMLGLLAYTRNVYINQNKAIFIDRLAERTKIFDLAFENKGDLVKAGVLDGTASDDLVSFIKSKKPSVANNKINSMVSNYQSSAAWIYRPDFKLAYSTSSSDLDTAPDLNLLPTDFAILFGASSMNHFYLRTDTGIMDIYGGTIVPSSDAEHKTSPQGYLFLANLIDSKYIANLSEDSHCDVRFILPEQIVNNNTRFNANLGVADFTRTIKDVRGNILGEFFVTYKAVGVKQFSDQRVTLSAALVLTYVILATVLTLFTWAMVLTPLRRIYNALLKGEREPLVSMINKENEFSKIAEQIVRNFEMESSLFKEKAGIERVVQERTEELRQQQTRLSSSIQSLSSGLLMIYSDNSHTVYNPAFSKIINLANKPLAIQNNIELVDVIQKSITSKANLKIHIEKCIEKGKSFKLNDVVINEKYYRVTGAAIKDSLNNEANGCVILFEDMTEQKNLDKSKDEFMSIASHELRTPLTAIRGNAALLLQLFADKITDLEAIEMISDIKTSSIRLIDVVNHFLTMSRLEQGRANLLLKPEEVEPIIEDAVKSLQTLAAEKNLKIKLELSDTVNLALLDASKFQEVMINLVSNSLKYTDKGHVTISSKKIDNKVVILIQDTGKGIDPKYQHELFGKFQQASKDLYTRDYSQSTGLGLYITKLLVEQMNGVVRLDRSEVDKGSTFSIVLPVVVDKKDKI